VYAGVTGDLELLKQAALHDPLTGAVCSPEEIWQMVDEMLVAGKKWLPQFAGDMSGAKKRLAAAKRNGTYKGTHSTKGACRKKTKKVAAKKTAKKKVAKKKVAKKKVAKKK
jgi:alpha-galactosidase